MQTGSRCVLVGLLPELTPLHFHDHMETLGDVEIASTIKPRQLYHIPLLRVNDLTWYAGNDRSHLVAV